MLARDDAREQVDAYGGPERLSEYQAGLARYWATRETD